MELASDIQNRLISEAVKRQLSQQQDFIQKIKRKGRKEIEEVEETKQLDNINYQRFRRTLGLVIEAINNASESIRDAIDDLKDLDKSYNAFVSVTDIIEDWNNMIVSLSLMGYNKLEKNDKDKVYNDIKTILPALEGLRRIVDRNAQVFNVDQELINNAEDTVNKMIEQIKSNIFAPISIPVGTIPERPLSDKEKKEKERLEKERLEKERLEKERLEKERLEKERLEQEAQDFEYFIF